MQKIFAAILLCCATSATSYADTQATNNPATAIQKSVDLITASWRAYPKQEKSCFTCHNHAMPVFAFNIASEAGYDVDDNIINEIATHGQHDYSRRTERIASGAGVGGQANSASYALTLLYASSWPRDKTTNALVDYLLLKQKDDGRWETPSHRPPSGASDFTSTALASRAIYYYATDSQKPKSDKSLKLARKWLTQTTPQTTEDKTFHLLGLHWFEEPTKTIKAARKNLLSDQHKNGGWSQMPNMQPDAYATGQALVALHHAGQLPTTHPAYQRGLQFLLQFQKQDGSWHVVTRADPIQDYYESGFPHGDDQFISLSATCWAAIALAFAHPAQ
jgi:hypothetical protein